jgi:hypothetical protein
MRQKAIRDLILKEQLKGTPYHHSISNIDKNFDRYQLICFEICKQLLLSQSLFKKIETNS